MDFSFRFNQYEFSYKPLILLVFSALLAACGDESSTSTEPDTVAEAPSVVSTTPADMATKVSRTDPVIATFTETIQLSSINSNRFTLEGPDGFIASSISASGTVAALTPDNSLALLTPYTATLSSTISGLSDNALGTEYSWSFTTEDGRWGRAAPIETDNMGDASYPKIAMDAQGNALAVWYQDDGDRTNIWANHFIPGSGWGTATLIESDNAGSARDPQIAINAQGIALAVWYQDDGDRTNIWANRFTPDSGWGVAELIETDDTDDAYDPQIAIDSQGNALAVWLQSDISNYNLWANRYTSGSGWGTPELIESVDTGSVYDPHIRMDAQGNALTVWRQYDGTLNHIWSNRYIPGTGWDMATLIESDETSDVYDPQIAVDAQGNALALWSQFDGGRYSIFANRYTPGSGWGTEELIENEDEGNAYSPQIKFDTHGNAIAVWQQSDGSLVNIWANRYIPGNGWGTATLVESSDEGNAYSPQIALDTQGNGLAVWHQYKNSQVNIWANRYIQGNGWNTAALIELDNAGEARTPQIEIDAQGQALAVWHYHDGIRSNVWANRFE